MRKVEGHLHRWAVKDYQTAALKLGKLPPASFINLLQQDERLGGDEFSHGA